MAWAAIAVTHLARDTAENFLSAASEGRLPDARALAPAIHDLEAFQEVTNGTAPSIVRLFANENAALVVTSDIAADHGRVGPLVITLRKQNDQWLVQDVDVASSETTKDEIERFLTHYPDTVELPVE